MKKRREPEDDKTTPARSVSLPASFRPRSKPSPPVNIIKRVGDPEDDKFIPTRSISLPARGRYRFKHSPLDLDEPSIRLVRILPGPSFDGQIHLDIRHASTNSTYSCLSYVWGEQQDLCWITLGGQLFQVGQNLHAFLGSARKKPHLCSGWLWIDALCIDQSNKLERNHQVQQMGHIFSHAVKVISWLGTDELIAQFLRESPHPLSLFEEFGRTPARTSKRRSSNDHDDNNDAGLVDDVYPRPGMRHFFESNYWTRAWITQEVSLARFVTFMACDETVDRWQPPEEKADDATILGNHESIYYENYSHQWKGRSLIFLLLIFGNKQCHNRLDRVFALLGLCGEGSDVKVNYDISRADLAKRVLGACSNSFCLCTISLLNRILNLGGPNAGLNATVAEKELWGAMSLSAYNSEEIVWHGGTITVGLDMSDLCQSYSGRFKLTISPGNCHRVEDAGLKSTLYYNECDIVITGKVFWGVPRKESQHAYGCWVRYDRDTQIWHITLPFATLVHLSRIEGPSTLCTRAYKHVNRGKIYHATKLHVVWTNDPYIGAYIDAPDLSHSTSESLTPPSLRHLCSISVQPYLDSYGRPRQSAVFVYDAGIDNKDASCRSSPVELSENISTWSSSLVD